MSSYAPALITYLTRIRFEFGALAALGEELAFAGITRPLLCTDAGIVRAGLADRVRAALPAGMEMAIYDGTPGNPTEAAVRDAAAAFRAHGADGVIGLGGGSAMDLSKAASLMATHPDVPMSNYAVIEGGLARITDKVAPIVCIPTTAGTGSEVGRGGIIILADGRKVSIGSPHMLPRVALCDPELTFGLPPILTAATGMDAITHCAECFLSLKVNPPADAIALDGLSRAWRHLERATANGQDREARWEMLMASMEGAMAFQKGLGAVHALAHPLGAVNNGTLHHGTLNAVLLPHVIRFNAPAVHQKFATLAQVMGLTVSAATEEGIAGAFAALSARLGLPATLGAMGVPRTVIPDIAVAATKDHCHPGNPRLASVTDYQDILSAAF